MFSNVLLVGVGGFFGSITRYFAYLWVGARFPAAFPLGTLLINISGCFVIGLVGVLLERASPDHSSIALLASVGFLGAYTTFSAFGFETLSLMQNGRPAAALVNVLANVLLGLIAVWAGRSIVLVLG